MVKACAYLSHWIPDKILSCSEAARQIHVDCGYAEDKLVVVPNGFDLGYFQPDPLARVAVRIRVERERGYAFGGANRPL